MRFLVDKSTLSVSSPPPAAILISHIENPLRPSQQLALRFRKAALKTIGNGYVPINGGPKNYADTDVQRKAIIFSGFSRPDLLATSHGVALDAALCIALEQKACIKAYGFDRYKGLIWDLRLFLADEHLLSSGSLWNNPHLPRPSVGDLVLGVETLDCRRDLRLMSIFGGEITDMPGFSIDQKTGSILVVAFAQRSAGSTTAFPIAQSAVALIQENTSATGIEPCFTLVLD
jgi:hypothetical protein